MPRPTGGYRNKAGEQVPGVHDITNAFCPKPALVNWAARVGWEQGRAGRPLKLYEKGTLDIGSTVHAMCELDLKGRPYREIEACAHGALTAPGDLAKAWSAYGAFKTWRDECEVASIAHEVSLVSEIHQLGGTPDCIALMGGRTVLLDFKTCTSVPREPYREQRLVMAAHSALWNEAYPDNQIQGCHIVYLPKDGRKPAHHSYADLSKYWLLYRAMLAAFRIEHDLKPAPRPRTIETVMPAPKAVLKQELEDAVNEAMQSDASSTAIRTMAEILRSYGHVRT